MGEIIPAATAPVTHLTLKIDTVTFKQVKGQREPDLYPRKRGQSVTWIVGTQNITDTNRSIEAGTNFHLHLKFKISKWQSESPTMNVLVGSQLKVVKAGDTEVVFDDVLDIDPIVNCYYPLKGVVITDPTKIEVIHRNILHINWNLAGAGIVTIPVLPIKIIYVPVADSKLQNNASVTETNVQGYATNLAISSTRSNSNPVPTSVSKMDDFLSGMQQVGQAMEKNGDPDVQAVGKAVNIIATVIKGGLGSQTLTATVSDSQTEQQSISVTASQTDQIGASCGSGGPGDGDVIAFYQNAQLVWYADHGKMHIMLLGYDPTLKTPTARQLKNQLATLAGKPAGTKDNKWQLDAKSILALLSLDPFSGPNKSFSQLDPSRFSITYKGDGSVAKYQNGGAKLNVTVSHQITASDSHSVTAINTSVEVDKPGFLSFLGGPSEDKTVQLVYSKSKSSQYTVGQTATASYTFNGDGAADHYRCQVFFDNVFGTFAFRDDSHDNDVKNTNVKIIDNLKH